MTSEDLQIAVAEKMGWKLNDKNVVPRQYFHESDFKLVWETQLPPYSTSLDAIQKAAMERFTTEDEWCSFDVELNDYFRASTIAYQWQLTALDWCKAFLQTCEQLKGDK